MLKNPYFLKSQSLTTMGVEYYIEIVSEEAFIDIRVFLYYVGQGFSQKLNMFLYKK